MQPIGLVFSLLNNIIDINHSNAILLSQLTTNAPMRVE